MEDNHIINNSADRISDEEFLKNYEKHNKKPERSNKYDKKKQNKGLGVTYLIFLISVFIAAYFLFTKFLFTPLQ